MDLSIIIVNWNTREFLSQCLRSVDKTVCTGTHLRVETIVVDNASADGSAQTVREQFAWSRLIENAENVGFARANNQALQQSRARYVLLLNSDTEVYPGAVEAMVSFMDEHPEAAGCGPRLLNADGSLQPSCHPVLTPGREFWRLMFLDRIWRRATYDQKHWDLSKPRRVEVIKGACLLLRRAALDQVGLLDAQYYMYTEEMDLCYRLLRAGWELWWVPWAEVTHYGEASTRQAAEEMYVQLYRSKAQFHRKYGGEREVRRFRRLLGLAYAPRWALVALGSLAAPSLAARARIYRSLLRARAAL
ncbi:MAG: glycosyltransferase family 2 protein [Anaerolineae bacterium]|nr:glycosyltransferase family 2 protein [Anaerolineae bacterium]